jgi:hypothetical protein
MQGHDNTFSHCFQACKVHDSIESANQSHQTLSVFTSSLLLITIQQSVWQTVSRTILSSLNAIQLEQEFFLQFHILRYFTLNSKVTLPKAVRGFLLGGQFLQSLNPICTIHRLYEILKNNFLNPICSIHKNCTRFQQDL